MAIKRVLVPVDTKVWAALKLKAKREERYLYGVVMEAFRAALGWEAIRVEKVAEPKPEVVPPPVAEPLTQTERIFGKQELF